MDLALIRASENLLINYEQLVLLHFGQHPRFTGIRKLSSVDQAVIDLVETMSIWGVPGLEVNSFVHEVRTFDRHLPACGKVD
jgi:hypothetical protein